MPRQEVERAAIVGERARVVATSIEEVGKLAVDVRVGSYEFDSSVSEMQDFLVSTKGTSYYARPDGPIDDSPMALRTAFWLLTDEKYKSALAQFLKKKGEDVYAVEDPKRPPSFSQTTAVPRCVVMPSARIPAVPASAAAPVRTAPTAA